MAKSLQVSWPLRHPSGGKLRIIHQPALAGHESTSYLGAPLLKTHQVYTESKKRPLEWLSISLRLGHDKRPTIDWHTTGLYGLFQLFPQTNAQQTHLYSNRKPDRSPMNLQKKIIILSEGEGRKKKSNPRGMTG